MRLRLPPLLTLLLLTAACRPTPPAAPDPGRLDAVARRYVVLGLGLGAHDANYVDAYYGPDSLRAGGRGGVAVRRGGPASAESLIAVLGDSVPAYADSLVACATATSGSSSARWRRGPGCWAASGSPSTRRRRRSTTRRRRTTATPTSTRCSRGSTSLLPGRGPLAERYQRFRDRLMIPAAQVDTVFKTAIAACRARTLAHLPLPPGERFDLEYVKGTPWNAYNWYKGNYHSLIQVNLDFPIPLDRAVDLACHEGYPGAPRLQRAARAGAGAASAAGSRSRCIRCSAPSR